jgi:hypothetical protein
VLTNADACFMTSGAFTADGRMLLSEAQVPILAKPFDVARIRALLRQRR